MSDTVELLAQVTCEHNWQSPHCIKDAEGSCPYAYDQDNPDADCRCEAAGLREPSVGEVIQWLPDELWDVIASHLSAIEWIPARTHPQSMRDQLSKALAAALAIPTHDE